jgi:hypothetical protein
MSYSNPAPFKNLKSMAEGMTLSLEALEKHPEGANAFAQWVDDADFNDRYGTRYKDLPVDQDVPEGMILLTDFFSIDAQGLLCVESYYNAFTWVNGAWVDDDEGEEDGEGEEDEDDGPESGEEDGPE